MDKFSDSGSNIVLECKRDLIMKNDQTDQVKLAKRTYPFTDSQNESPSNKNLDGSGFNIENLKIKRLNFVKDFDVMVLGEILYIVILDETCIRLYKLYLDIELETLNKVKIDPVKNFFQSSVCKKDNNKFIQIVQNKVQNEQHINCTLLKSPNQLLNFSISTNSNMAQQIYWDNTFCKGIDLSNLLYVKFIKYNEKDF